MTVDRSDIEAMIEKARAHSESLGELLEQYRPILRRIAQEQIPVAREPKCDVSGIVQHTILEAYRGFERFLGRSEGELIRWLKRIHSRNIVDCARRLRPEAELPSTMEPADDTVTPSQRVARCEQAHKLEELVQSLPEMQREAVRLRHLEGWSVEKIAGHLNRSVTATAGLLKRGLQGLREKMSKDSWMSV